MKRICSCNHIPSHWQCRGMLHKVLLHISAQFIWSEFIFSTAESFMSKKNKLSTYFYILLLQPVGIVIVEHSGVTHSHMCSLRTYKLFPFYQKEAAVLDHRTWPAWASLLTLVSWSCPSQPNSDLSSFKWKVQPKYSNVRNALRNWLDLCTCWVLFSSVRLSHNSALAAVSWFIALISETFYNLALNSNNPVSVILFCQDKRAINLDIIWGKDYNA